MSGVTLLCQKRISVGQPWQNLPVIFNSVSIKILIKWSFLFLDDLVVNLSQCLPGFSQSNVITFHFRSSNLFFLRLCLTLSVSHRESITN